MQTLFRVEIDKQTGKWNLHFYPFDGMPIKLVGEVLGQCARGAAQVFKAHDGTANVEQIEAEIQERFNDCLQKDTSDIGVKFMGREYDPADKKEE